MQIQWYPGHMAKAKRQMQEDIRLVDVVMELVDARIPSSSHNPDIASLSSSKERIILLNKADLADPVVTKEWLTWFSDQGLSALACDARDRSSIKAVERALDAAAQRRSALNRAKGMSGRTIRSMVVGIPNVGKSTFINAYSGRSSAKTGNKPGVTKADQWIRAGRNALLLDTPGLLWPKFDDETCGLHLAWIGSINDQILDETDIACRLIEILTKSSTGCLKARYKVDESLDAPQILDGIARARGCLMKGGVADLSKGARALLDDFRSGRLGRITLETPPDI